MNEAETRAELIDPALKACGWGEVADTKLKELIQYAHRSGASDVVIISAKNILAEKNLADKCREPRCENYGMSKSCPPHVSGSSWFRKHLKTYTNAIFFKIDVPSEVLFSYERLEIFRLLHEIAAGIEHSAVKMGFLNAQAYAGGSCKTIFCHDQPECLALSKKGECRHPKSARPSMSGFGINVSKLFKIAGWTMNWESHDSGLTTIKMANVCGLVLIH